MSFLDTDTWRVSVLGQSELAGLSRSSIYYQAKGESQENLHLMRLLDEQYLKTPFYGYRRMSVWLQGQGYGVNPKRVQRLMQQMGLAAIYPKPDLSKTNREHKIYPYLLKNLVIDQINQVWSSDITYIPMAKGFLYLVAIIDWYSRYVLSWELSNSLDSSFCISTLQTSLQTATPQLFNTDQGTQFTCEAFVGCLLSHQIQVSMDGKGRAIDNIFVERLWRSVKYEEVYLKSYQSGQEAYDGLADYFYFYNHLRPHQSLNYLTPAQVYFQMKEKVILEKVPVIVRL